MAMVKKVSKKKSVGRRLQTVISAPLIRRCPTTAVVLQGWLSKRGSEGLMLWKKRWCVLTDYCFFYYKDFEEQKLVGSFLVASYKISVCGPEDKINRNFSFKAEHNNMKTFYFSADNIVVMADWVKALTLASLVQEVPRRKEIDVGYELAKDLVLNHRNDTGNCVLETLASAFQPLYVNAPPKPRRLNDSCGDDPLEGGGDTRISRVPHHDHPIDAKMRESNTTMPARPRSADLLSEQDNQNKDEYTAQPRPKSSMSRLTPPPHTIVSFEPWSEQDYAEKMRKSAMYVAPQTKLMNTRPSTRHIQSRHNHQTSQPSCSQAQPLYYNRDSEFYDQFKRSASARIPGIQNKDTCKSPVNFVAPVQDSTNLFSKSQQREQSMKRLLEWKQRMLHSPLTQKLERNIDNRRIATERPNITRSQKETNIHQLHWKEDTLCSYNRQSDLDRHVLPEHSMKMANTPFPTDHKTEQYNPQDILGAGKWDSSNITAPDSTYVILNKDYPEMHSILSENQIIYRKSKNLLAPILEPFPPNTASGNFSHEISYSPHLSDKVIKEFSYHYVKCDKEAERETRIELKSYVPEPTASSLKKIHKVPDTSLSPRDEKKISSDSERDEEVAAVLSQNVGAESTSQREMTPKTEENYMLMSPRKKDSQDNNRCDSETRAACSPGNDESPYVEMTQKEASSRINKKGDTAFEKMVNQDPKVHFDGRMPSTDECGGSVNIEGKSEVMMTSTSEPLYMEVRENVNERHTLPDILNSAGSFNHGRQASFSSDADDEASKDLDSSDLRPRFSLSDTFRPASYYLGGTGCDGNLLPLDSDQHDSSDSDLVWPPPIPTTSPPLQHLDTSVDSINKSPSPFMNLTLGQRSVTPTSDEESVKWRRKTLKRRPLSADILNNLNEFNSECNETETLSRNRVLSKSNHICEGNTVLEVNDSERKDGNAPYYYSDLLKVGHQRNDGGHQRQNRWRSLEGLFDRCDEQERAGEASIELWLPPEQDSLCSNDKQQSTDRRARSLEELDRQPHKEHHILPLLMDSHSNNDSIDTASRKAKTENEEESTSEVKTNEEIPHAEPEQKEKHNWNLKLSAGELLGRTHEELVLLLIQLRRQRARICKSMEGCHREIEAQQACLSDLVPTQRIDHLQKLEELKVHLGELEKQYEKGKPLVNLVDNMVKLGSLYQGGSGRPVPSSKLEFNHKVEEARLLAEERRDWERIQPDHHDLQAKVEQLYRLDKLLREESGTLHSLQEDKGLLERALGGLKNKLQTVHGNSAETEWYRRQQRLLEKELTRVRSILALNSKKLEETVAENGRLEQELVVLRQKLQVSRRSGIGTDGTCSGIGMGGGTAALESELWRVQVLVGNLLRQRHELSLQVSQLTEKSNSLSQQIYSNTPLSTSPCYSYPNDSACNSKKSVSHMWVETDLDTDKTVVTTSVPVAPPRQHTMCISPLYVNTNAVHSPLQTYGESSCSFPEDFVEDVSSPLARSPELYKPFETEDDNAKRSQGLSWKDRPQEIKTVRIVKRESERRQRDRDRSGNLGIPIGGVTSIKKAIPDEQPIHSVLNDFQKFSHERIAGSLDCISSMNDLPEPPPPAPRSDSVNTVRNIVNKNRLKGNLLGGSSGPTSTDKSERVGSSVSSTGASPPQLSPVYLSETARRIVEEVAWQGKKTGTIERRLIPREKRRHHTVSGPSISTQQQFVFTGRSSRDDLDMERVLRPRLTTPDVVKSTLHRPDTFTNETIDRLLGTPGKIIIPERYIPEMDDQPPSVEERARRSRKATAIRKMLTETTTVSHQDLDEDEEKCIPLKDKVEEEKRNREHLLQLSQILAQEVMEKSKIVAVRAMARLPLKEELPVQDLDDLSPVSTLPLYQQRENFFS